MRAAHLIFLLASLVLFTPIFTAPWLASRGHGSLSSFNYALYSTVCHQRADRSFFIFGAKMGVCSRCFGIYLGIVLGSLAYPLLRRSGRMPAGWIILAALAPMALDGGTQLTGLRESTNILRTATGLLFGAAVPYYLIPALDAVLEELTPFLYGAADKIR
jgi:uncharacterized membrane protein